MKAYEVFDPRDGITRRVVWLRLRARWITWRASRRPLLSDGRHAVRCWDYQQVDR